MEYIELNMWYVIQMSFTKFYAFSNPLATTVSTYFSIQIPLNESWDSIQYDSSFILKPTLIHSLPNKTIISF